MTDHIDDTNQMPADFDDTQDLGETEPVTPIEVVTEAAEPVAEPVIEVGNERRRVFVIGGTRIPESDSTIGMSNEQIRDSLKASFPEVANATIRERVESGVSYVEFLPQPGRKG